MKKRHSMYAPAGRFYPEIFCLYVIVSVIAPTLPASPQKKPESATLAIPQEIAAVEYAKIAVQANPGAVIDIVNKGKPGNWPCASCHGDRGQGSETVPRLAGLPAGYLVKQLHNFADGSRHNASMAYVVADLNAEEMAALGRYYSQLQAPGTAYPTLGGGLARGRQLAQYGDWSVDIPACFSCHGSSGWGVGEAFPALAGQHPSYVAVQLGHWKSGKRANSPMQLMRNIARAMSDEDIAAVADYLAKLPPPQSLQPEKSIETQENEADNHIGQFASPGNR